MVKPATTVAVVRRFVVAPARKGASMLRKRHFFGALVVSLVLIAIGLPGVARASTVAQLNLTDRSDYSCVGPCATAIYFSVDGILHSDSRVFGTMKLSAVGTTVSFDPNTQCLLSSINYALTTQKGKNTIFLSTTDDTECPTGPNTSRETADLTITGGTGLFSSATGAATLLLTVLTHPQTGAGTFNLTITY
jgi:hypothetical protein